MTINKYKKAPKAHVENWLAITYIRLYFPVTHGGWIYSPCTEKL